MQQQCCSSATLQQCSDSTASALLLCAVLAVALRTSTTATVRLKATRSLVRDAAGAARLLLQRRRGSGCTALLCTAMPGALLPVLRPGHPKGCEPGCSLLLLGNVAHEWRGRARGDAHSLALRGARAARRGTARRARRGGRDAAWARGVGSALTAAIARAGITCLAVACSFFGEFLGSKIFLRNVSMVLDLDSSRRALL